MKRRAALLLPGSALALPLPARADINWGGLIISSFEGLGSNLDAVKAKAAKYTSVRTWKNVSDADVTAAGAAACALPVAAYAALPAEFAYLMREIYNSSMGIGFIIKGSAARADFANILGVWTDELKLDDALLARVYSVAEKVGSEVAENATEEAVSRAIQNASKQRQQKSQSTGGTGARRSGTAGATTAAAETHHASSQVVSQVLAEKSGTKAAGKLSTKVGAKAGAKVGAKYVAKGLTAWIPGVSAAVCAGVNWWIMRSIQNSAEEYFTAMHAFRQRRYRKLPPS